jgi:Protein of unknown function (DUF3795)
VFVLLEGAITDRKLEAFCGLYCGACPVYLNRADDWIVKIMLEEHGVTFDDLHCEGGRTDTLSPSCQKCVVRDCAKSKGLDSCSGCGELPCVRMAARSSVICSPSEIMDLRSGWPIRQPSGSAHSVGSSGRGTNRFVLAADSLLKQDMQLRSPLDRMFDSLKAPTEDHGKH